MHFWPQNKKNLSEILWGLVIETQSFFNRNDQNVLKVLCKSLTLCLLNCRLIVEHFLTYAVQLNSPTLKGTYRQSSFCKCLRAEDPQR